MKIKQIKAINDILFQRKQLKRAIKRVQQEEYSGIKIIRSDEEEKYHAYVFVVPDARIDRGLLLDALETMLGRNTQTLLDLGVEPPLDEENEDDK